MEYVIGDDHSGRIKVWERGDDVVVSVHWPFDRETDEWIDMSASFDRLALLHEMRVEGAEAYDHQSQGNKICMKELEDGRYRLELSGRNSFQPVTTELTLPRNIGVELITALRSSR